MAYVPIPKDLTNVKSKVLFNFTKRQLICFGCGALIGVPLFFAALPVLGTDAAAFLLIGILLPVFFIAFYEKNGRYAEQILQDIIRTRYLRPKERLYSTRSFYSVRGDGKEAKNDKNRKEQKGKRAVGTRYPSV